MKNFEYAALQKEMIIVPFVKCFEKKYFGKVVVNNFISTWNILPRHYVFVHFLLLVSYVLGALRKEMLMVPFVEPFKTANLGKSH